jgi:hypothetical protein
MHKNGMSREYKQNFKFQSKFKLILALAFVPNHKVTFEYEKLLDYFLNTTTEESLINCLLWFEKNYIKNQNYKKSNSNTEYFIWSVYDNIINDLPKTSNSLEGWHRALNSRISHKNPSLCELFKELQAEQNCNEVQILKSLYDEKTIENESYSLLKETSLNMESIMESSICRR